MKEYTKEEIIKMFKLNTLSKEEIKKQYVLYKMFPYSFGGNVSLDESKNVLLEEAKITVSPDRIFKEFGHKFGMARWQIFTNKSCNDVDIVMLASDIGDNKEMVIDVMKNLGWFEVGTQTVIVNGMRWVAITFDPMFQEDVFDEIIQTRHLYHWTPFYNLSNIQKIGLVPKTESKLGYHPERVYFISGKESMDEIMNLGKQFYENNRNVNNDGRYVLLELDTSLLKNYKVKFSYDPHADKSVYTSERIPPEMLTVYMMYDFKDKKNF